VPFSACHRTNTALVQRIGYIGQAFRTCLSDRCKDRQHANSELIGGSGL